jgi:heme-degrading monooxygenase HmoA
MIINVTSIKLKSVWLFFRLTMHGFKIQQQAKKSKGFIKMKNTGFGYDHFTLSVWENSEDLKSFAVSGAHKEAMKISRELAREIRTYTYTAENIPGWSDVKKLLQSNSKVITYNNK